MERTPTVAQVEKAFGFQSPRNRVNTSNLKSRGHHDAAQELISFNPLEIGSTLQMDKNKLSESGHVKEWFQSPRNRVNTSNAEIIEPNTARASVIAFQSPRNRVNTSNPRAVFTLFSLSAWPKFQSPRNRVNTSNCIVCVMSSGISSQGRFNPLEIGSTLQIQCGTWGHIK